jgi:hypothetical protein
MSFSLTSLQLAYKSQEEVSRAMSSLWASKRIPLTHNALHEQQVRKKCQVLTHFHSGGYGKFYLLGHNGM